MQDGAQYRRNRLHLSVDPDKSPLTVVPDPLDAYPQPVDPPRQSAPNQNQSAPNRNQSAPIQNQSVSPHVQSVPNVPPRPSRSKTLPSKFKDYVVTLK